MTIIEFCEKLDISRPTYYNWMSKPQIIPYKKLERLSELFRIPIEQIIDSEQNKTIYMSENDLLLIAKHQKAIEEIINKYKK